MRKNLEFTNSRYKKLYFGENCYVAAIHEIITENTFKNIFFISTNSLYNTNNYNSIKESVGDLLVAEFSKSQAHTPQSTVNEAVQTVRNCADIEAIIAFGGGSVMDLAKAVATELNESSPPLIIALPTTLSGAEFNANLAVSDAAGVKHLIVSPLLAPAWIILDPVLTENTPDSLWASTGFKTYSGCIESICSKNANAYTDQLAFSGLRLLSEDLLESYRNPHNLTAKQNVLLAPAFALPAAVNSWLGLVAAFRHQLGAQFKMDHGMASAIMTPHVLKWNFDFSVAQYAALADFLDLGDRSESKEALARKLLKHVDQLSSKLNLNQKLSTYVSDKSLLEKVIVPILEGPCTAANAREVTSEQEIYDLLESAW